METTYTPRLGSSIDEVTREMVALADKVGGPVEAKFNDMVLRVTPRAAQSADAALGPLVDRWLAARDALKKTDPWVSVTDTRAAIREYDAALVAIVEARRGADAAAVLAGALTVQRGDGRG